MSRVVIYHHYDQDGYCAAAIVRAALQKTPLPEIEMRVGSYDNDTDEPALERADWIYVLDYRLPMGLMDKYFDKIVWIDHHKSSIIEMEKIEKSHGKSFTGMRVIGQSGCLLTWFWFNGLDVETPLVVKLVNDRDIWAWKFGEDTAAFHEASRTFLIYYDMWEQMLFAGETLTTVAIERGKTLLNHIRGVVDTYNDTYAWEGMFEGHPVVFLNGSSMISGELHKRLRERFSAAFFAVVFMLKQDKVTVGMYRSDNVNHINLGQIALKYGGGGHEGAAGFSTDHEEWIQIIKESNYASSGYTRRSN